MDLCDLSNQIVADAVCRGRHLSEGAQSVESMERSGVEQNAVEEGLEDGTQRLHAGDEAN